MSDPEEDLRGLAEDEGGGRPSSIHPRFHSPTFTGNTCRPTVLISHHNRDTTQSIRIRKEVTGEDLWFYSRENIALSLLYL